VIESAQTRHTRVTELRGSALLRLSDSQSVSSCVRAGFEHSVVTSRNRHSAANGSGNRSESQGRAIMCSSSLGQNRPAFTAQTRTRLYRAKNRHRLVIERRFHYSSYNGAKIQKPAAMELFGVFIFAISLLDRDTQCIRQPQVCLFQTRIQPFRVAESVLAG
jgi:hypothetical protein